MRRLVHRGQYSTSSERNGYMALWWTMVVPLLTAVALQGDFATTLLAVVGFIGAPLIGGMRAVRQGSDYRECME